MGRCHCNVYMRTITCDCGRRCQGSPTTSASNCACVSVMAAALPSTHFGQTKLPALQKATGRRCGSPKDLTCPGRALRRRGRRPGHPHGQRPTADFDLDLALADGLFNCDRHERRDFGRGW